MKERPKEPATPPERKETIRQEIMEMLSARTCSAREISEVIRVSEREAYEHLEHIHLSSHKKGYHFVVTPAECRKCGFVFRKREKLKKPGKCPVCRSESIEEPLFALKI